MAWDGRSVVLLYLLCCQLWLWALEELLCSSAVLAVLSIVALCLDRANLMLCCAADLRLLGLRKRGSLLLYSLLLSMAEIYGKELL